MNTISSTVPANERRVAKLERQLKRKTPAPSSLKIFLNLLERLKYGRLTLHSPDGAKYSFKGRDSGPQAEWIVHDWSVFQRTLAGGSLGFGESYVDGDWDVSQDKLCEFIGIILKNEFDSKFSGSTWQLLRFFAWRLLHSTYFRSVARRCVQSHYDLSNEFYSLMLDPSMAYSCGFQFSAQDSLQQMQQNKYELVCRKLDLARARSLIDVGCGWGGMLIYAARKFPELRCYGVTLSKAQCELANKRIMEQGLSDRITIELRDYRDVQGSFDRFVSIGMFEHLDHSLYGNFMRAAANFLKPDGLGLLHSIGTLDAPALAPDAWINTYIFPGSRLPRLEELNLEIRRAGLTVGHIENFKPHYAITLRKWKENFDDARAKISAFDSKFDRNFMRLWNYYLQVTEAGFRYGNMQLYQLLFCKGREWKLPQIFRWF